MNYPLVKGEALAFSAPCWSLRFVIPAAPSGELICLTKNLTAPADTPLLSARMEDNRLQIRLWIEGRPSPLLLQSQVREGQTALLQYRKYRAELFLDGVLADEDWPYGDFSLADCRCESCCRDAGLSDQLTDLPRPARPDGFRAEGFRPIGHNAHAGDCMPFFHDGTYHLFYLFDRRGHQSKWGLGAHQWAHMSSTDLIHWKEHPMAVEIDRPEEGSICTGSVICHEGRYYAFYTVRSCDGSPAKISCSVSEDGVHFQKTPVDFTLSPRYHQASARDPKVFQDETGRFHMLLTTSLMEQGENGFHPGCLARLTSDDLLTWREEEPLVVLETQVQPECSDYFRYGGRYYLTYGDTGLVRYFISDQPLGPWRAPQGADNQVVGSHYRVPKCAQWKDGRLIFAGFYIDKEVEWGGTIHFYQAQARPDGSLEFAPLPEGAALL